MAERDDYVDQLALLAGLVLGQEDLHTTLLEMCRVAVAAVPGADGASLTTIRDGAPAALADSDWSRGLDELQFVEHEGPCLDAMRVGNLFRVPDLADEPRWPTYAPRAVAAGARSMVSLPLVSEGRLVGALNIYSRERDSFDAEAVSIAEIVTAHAGVASQVAAAFFRHKQLAEDLQAAMQSRAVIEQAKGMLMLARGCDADEAFALLVRMSQRANRKLRDVAQQLVSDPRHVSNLAD